MKKTLGVLVFFVSFSVAYAQMVNQVSDPVEWINPLMGTDSKPSLSNGNTYPAIAVPWGMNFWSPQTGTMGNGWAYTYAADKIRGFKQTHQPSPDLLAFVQTDCQRAPMVLPDGSQNHVGAP